MTDKDRLVLLLNDFGVGFVDKGDAITCEIGCEKVSGYSGFFTEFQFDKDGKFIELGAWE